VAANKIKGIRAGNCEDYYSAHQGVEHDAMNVLVLGGRIVGAALALPAIGSLAPFAIGTTMLASAQIRWALYVTFCKEPLPDTVVIPRSSIAGFAAASRIAIASSCPGSQSRMIGVGKVILPLCRIPRKRQSAT
jgi:hypothetical protein